MPSEAGVVTELEHARRAVWVWGSAAGVLGRSRGAARPVRLGFTVLFDDAPDPEELEEPRRPPALLVCLHCLTATRSSTRPRHRA